MVKLLYSLVFLIAFVGSADAQRVLKTESGQEILILPDGSWRYLENGETPAEVEDDFLLEDGDNIDPFEQPNQDPEWDIAERARLDELIKKLRFQEAEAGARLLIVQDNKRLLKEEISLAEQGALEDVDAGVDELRQEYELVEHSERIAKLRYKVVSDLLRDANDVSKAKPEKRTELMSNLEMKWQSIDLGEEVIDGEKQAQVRGPQIEDYFFEVNADDVVMTPPAPTCNIVFDGIDEGSKYHRRDVALAYFFGYTHPKLQTYFKEDDFLTCHAFVSKFGGYNLINIQVTIASKSAPKSYGSLDRGSLLVIKLMNGEKVYGINVSPDAGRIEPYTANTVYRASYTLENSELKALSKNEVDRVGILWSSGYEEYEVYNVDFLIHQVTCLNRK